MTWRFDTVERFVEENSETDHLPWRYPTQSVPDQRFNLRCVW